MYADLRYKLLSSTLIFLEMYLEILHCCQNSVPRKWYALVNFVCRSQEEESLKAAIAISKQETLEGEGEGGEEEEPTTNGSSNDLLLDFDTSGK